jgi:hypothetical protein
MRKALFFVRLLNNPRDAASTFNAVTRGNLPVGAFSRGVARVAALGQTGKASPALPASIFYPGRQTITEALDFDMRKACPKSYRLAHGSAAHDRKRSPLPYPARCPRSGCGHNKNPPSRTHGLGGFVITSGSHRVPTLYRETTLADSFPVVIRFGDRARFFRWLGLIAWPLPSSLSLRESAAVFPRCYLASDHRLMTASVIVRVGCPVRPARLS